MPLKFSKQNMVIPWGLNMSSNYAVIYGKTFFLLFKINLSFHKSNNSEFYEKSQIKVSGCDKMIRKMMKIIKISR